MRAAVRLRIDRSFHVSCQTREEFGARNFHIASARVCDVSLFQVQMEKNRVSVRGELFFLLNLLKVVGRNDVFSFFFLGGCPYLSSRSVLCPDGCAWHCFLPVLPISFLI